MILCKATQIDYQDKFIVKILFKLKTKDTRQTQMFKYIISEIFKPNTQFMVTDKFKIQDNIGLET
jgi:hypothetical protein